MSRSAKPTIPALTGLRFFAAFHVLLLHAAMPLLGDAPLLLKNFAGSGYVGVSFFFVLSGFILTYNYVDADGEMNVRAGSFWLARVARVVPVYLVGAIVWVPIFIREVTLNATGGAFELVASVIIGIIVPTLLIQAWYPPAVYFLNPPGWSLSVETFFYGTFPFLLRQLRRLTSSGMIAFGSFIWVASLVAPFVYLIFDPDGIGAGSAESKVFWLDALKFNPLARLPEFVIGMVAGRFFLMKGRIGGISPRAHSVIGVLLISLILTMSSFIPYPLLHNGLLAPLYAYFIFSLASNEGPIAAFLSKPFLVLLGEASYSLYLLHLPVARWMLKSSSIIGVNMASISYFLIYCSVAILVSIIVLRFIEEPARRFIRVSISQRKSVTTVI